MVSKAKTRIRQRMPHEGAERAAAGDEAGSALQGGRSCRAATEPKPHRLESALDEEQGRRSHRDHNNCSANGGGISREGPPAWHRNGGLRSRRKLDEFGAMRAAWDAKARWEEESDEACARLLRSVASTSPNLLAGSRLGSRERAGREQLAHMTRERRHSKALAVAAGAPAGSDRPPVMAWRPPREETDDGSSGGARVPRAELRRSRTTSPGGGEWLRSADGRWFRILMPDGPSNGDAGGAGMGHLAPAKGGTPPRPTMVTLPPAPAEKATKAKVEAEKVEAATDEEAAKVTAAETASVERSAELAEPAAVKAGEKSDPDESALTDLLVHLASPEQMTPMVHAKKAIPTIPMLATAGLSAYAAMMATMKEQAVAARAEAELLQENARQGTPSAAEDDSESLCYA